MAENEVLIDTSVEVDKKTLTKTVRFLPDGTIEKLSEAQNPYRWRFRSSASPDGARCGCCGGCLKPLE